MSSNGLRWGLKLELSQLVVLRTDFDSVRYEFISLNTLLPEGPG